MQVLVLQWLWDEGNRKVTCGMASSQFADSFCFLGWPAAAQTDFFNVLFLFFLAYQFDCQEDKVHIFFYSYKPEFLNAKITLNNIELSFPCLLSNLHVLAFYLEIIE